ncbi:MAG: hypothetical protein JWN45_1193, partial [Acidobacteriaceae bacterium]|nr:hypothetical protein [Acidobacteriaceae bacterium]
PCGCSGAGAIHHPMNSKFALLLSLSVESSQSGFDARAGIEIIAQGVADEVE